MRAMLSWRGAAALVAAALLSGCASTWVVSSDVKTFSQLSTVPAPATYRFERLPSQQSAPAVQASLEAAAEPALSKAGWVRNDAAARYSVLIGSTVVTTAIADPWAYRYGMGPWGPYGPYSSRWHARHGFYGPGWGWQNNLWDGPQYEREVSVIIRDLATQQVVYETRAAHAARWPNDAALLTPMFDAALSSFPQPPAGVRRVHVEVPHQK